MCHDTEAMMEHFHAEHGFSSVLHWLRVLVLGFSACTVGCDRVITPAAPPPHSVGVVTLVPQHIPVLIPLPGRVVPLRSAEVRPQVSGILIKRRFTEGQTVQAGEPLYQIDPIPYLALLRQMQGNLIRSQAVATQAHRTANRKKALLGTQYISPQDMDVANAQSQQADAQVLSDKAALKRAEINLNYTQVLAPVTGITGKSFSSEGALVTDGQTQPLTVIQQLDQVYVDMNEDSDTWLSLQQELHYGAIHAPPGPVHVAVTTGEGKYSHTLDCSLLFSDLTVDVTTGSLILRARCPNPEHILLPGMFVHAVVMPGMREKVLAVPQQAVTRTPDGQAIVMVVNDAGKVQVRPVQIADATEQQWLVTDGLQTGERVVVTGLQMLRPGMSVVVNDVTHSPQQHSFPSVPIAGTDGV